MSESSSEEDRISALPDALLLHILCFMDMRNVVRSSILSKRWRYVWTSVPTLRFEYWDYSLEEVGKFVAWVNRTLLLCSNSGAIEKLAFDFHYHDCFGSDLDVWVRFAAERKVGDLSFHLCGTWPQSLCCNSSLTSLHIYDCDFMPMRILRWTNLKNLKISSVELDDELILDMLSASPSLEYLNFDDCWGFNRLHINLETLKMLVISWDYGPDPLEISAPNLQNLQISGWVGQIQLKNVSSVRRAKLSFSLDHNYDEQYNCFVELLRSLHHVEELELGAPCIQVQLSLEAKGVQSTLSCLKCLKLNTNINKYDIPGIISVLKCSPNLEKLVVTKIKNDSGYRTNLTFSNQVECYWSSGTRFEKFPLPHLKTVKFFGFNNLGDVDGFTLTLLRVLVENAKLDGGVVINVGEHQLSIMPPCCVSSEYRIKFLKI